MIRIGNGFDLPRVDRIRFSFENFYFQKKKAGIAGLLSLGGQFKPRVVLYR